jgi:hypothetical protein
MNTARRRVSTQQIQTNFRRALRHGTFGLLAALAVCIAACGGGGGSSGGGTNNGSLDTSSLPPALTQQPISATSGAANTVPISVAYGVEGAPNIPTVSVTVCVHGTTNCTTVPNVQVDTQSYGLRLVASALQSIGSTLPVTPVSGGTLAECAAFADGYTWGTVRSADVQIGGETASDIPIQVLGDLYGTTAPCSDPGSGSEQDSASALGANGILGIGVAPWDCGTDCQTTVSGSMYYACPSSGNCTQTLVATGNQVANPIPHFTTDNNGVIVEMQPVPYSGAASATGTLVFGIGTRTNNVMNASQVFLADSYGHFTSTFNGRTLNAFIDSGSNALFFADSALPECGGAVLSTFYCPSTPQAFSATLIGTDNKSGSTSFAVVSAATLLGTSGNTGNFATNDLAGNYGSLTDLDLGLPFFYGRYVYFGQDQTATGGPLPYVAF